MKNIWYMYLLIFISSLLQKNVNLIPVRDIVWYDTSLKNVFEFLFDMSARKCILLSIKRRKRNPFNFSFAFGRLDKT